MLSIFYSSLDSFILVSSNWFEGIWTVHFSMIWDTWVDEEAPLPFVFCYASMAFLCFGILWVFSHCLLLPVWAFDRWILPGHSSDLDVQVNFCCFHRCGVEFESSFHLFSNVLISHKFCYFNSSVLWRAGCVKVHYCRLLFFVEYVSVMLVFCQTWHWHVLFKEEISRVYKDLNRDI